MIKIVATLILIATLIGCSESNPNLVCRDGKAFWQTTDGNITVFTPTYDDCEVSR